MSPDKLRNLRPARQTAATLAGTGAATGMGPLVHIPGIGTRFPEGGDDGRGPIPVVDTHKGMGAKGHARLDYAFGELTKIVAKAEARAQNPTNKILWIRLAVFGFSRGATLARAFVRDLLACKAGGYSHVRAAGTA